jgi:hypothetical protein
MRRRADSRHRGSAGDYILQTLDRQPTCPRLHSIYGELRF